MRSLSLIRPIPAFRSHQTLTSTQKQSVLLKLLMCAMAFVTMLFSAGSMDAQTLTLTPAVPDLYSGGFVNFASTPVTQSTTQTVQLKVTGGALTITSISVPTSTARTQQFNVGAITGCTIGASNATNTVCSIAVTFTPAYTGYQTSPLIAVTSNGTFRFGLNGFSTGPQAVLMPGLLSTFAGNGKVDGTAGTNDLQYTGDGGSATSAEVLSHGFAFDSLGDMYEAEYEASVIREINTSGVISTVAGTVTTAGGVTTSSQCGQPANPPFPNCGNNVNALGAATFGTQLSDIAFDSAGNLYIADTREDLVRRIDATTGIITTVAGTGAIAESGDGGAATAAGVDTPEAVAVDEQDNIYILDSNASVVTGGATVRFVNHATGKISTIAGNSTECGAGGAACGDGGPATSAAVGVSAAFYVDPTTGHFWIADRDANRIRFVNFNFTAPATAGTITTVAGNGTAGFAGDGGPATAAEFSAPHGIWVDPAGDIYISDRGNNRVRFVSAATGTITTLAGGGATCTAGGSGTCGDGGPANGPNANLTPNDVVQDVAGNLFIADQQNNAIREIIMNPTTLTFPTVAVGTTSGPLTATLLNIGTAPLVFTDPATTGVSNAQVTTTGPTAATSKAYSQTAATTCGPVFSTTAPTSLAAGSSCNYVVAFTPDTTTGNYTGTLVETDNSAVSTTQVVSLVGAATAGTVTIGVTSSVNPSTYGQNVTFTATVAGGGIAPTGIVTFTYTPTGSTTPVTIGTGTLSTTGGVTTATVSTTALPVGVDGIVATYSGDTNYTAGTASTPLPQVVNIASITNDTITASPNPSTSGQVVTLKFTVPDGATAPAGTTSVTFTTLINDTTTTLGTAAVTGVTAGGSTTYTTTTTALPVGTDTITGTFVGDTNYASGFLITTETVNQVGGTGDTVVVATNPTVVESPDTITFSIPVVSGAAVPSGTVAFTSASTSLGSATWPTTPVATGGFYTLQITTTALPLTVAPATSTPVLATFTAAGTSAYASATATTTVVVNQISNGADAVTAASGIIPVGTSDSLTFSIPVVTGAPVPTGTVVFTSGSTALGSATWPATPATGACPLGVGICYLLSDAPSPTNIPLTVAPAASTPITATYTATASSGYASAIATTTVVVNTASGAGDTVTVANNPTTYGTADPITFSIPVSAGAPVPAGTVTFTATGGVALGSATWAAPTATGGFYNISISPTNLPVGTDTVTATFAPSPGSGYGAAAPTTLVTVNPAGLTNDSISAAPNPQTFGSQVTLSFSVPNVNGTAPAPASTVTFTAVISGLPAILGTGAITGVTSGGVTTYTTTTTILPVGPNTITGTFTGDGNYTGGALVTVETITAATSGASLAANPNPATFGAPVTLTERIAPIGGTCPAGPATFLNGGVSIGTGTISLVGGSCVATLTTSTLPVGTDSITATVTASGGFQAISSGPVSVTINKVPATGDTLTTNPNPSTFGQPVAITETLPTVGGVAPTGSVTFFDNGTSIGTGSVINGVATITTSTLPEGTDPITATYTGDGNYATVTSGPVNQVVSSATGSATLAVGPNPATFGTPITLTETITPINGTCPTGPTTFSNNGTAIGTGTVSLTNGSCVATLTTSTLPVGTDSITASVPASGGFVATTSGPVALVISPANAADVLTSSPNPSVFGTPVAITDTIPIAVTGVPPTGKVNFYDFGTLIGTGTVNSSGIATITTSTLPVGTDSLTATYLGDTNYAQVTTAPVNQVVTAVSTTATLAVGPNPTNFGATVTMTETIPVTSGTPATGTVTFFSNGTQIGTGTLVNGVATITSSTLPVGTNQITATYNGDANYSSVKSGPVAEVVNTANGADTLRASPDPAVFGTTVTITDTIPTVGGVAPTGTVTFYDNGTPIGSGTVNASGVATLTTTSLPIGSDPITATYGGDPNYAPVTAGPVNEVVTVGNTTPVLGATPNPTTYGTTVFLTESIPGVNGIAPTGTVTFSDNGTAIGTANVVNGVATLTTSTLPIGTDPITATYSGDGTYGKVSSGPLNVVINKAAPTDTLTANPTPSVFGSPVTLTFTVPSVNGVAPTGTVSFYNGTTLLGTATVNAQGVATLTTSQLPFGTDTVTATYPGDNNYAPANPSTTIAVSPVAPTSVLTGPATLPACGSSVMLTDTITGVNGVVLGGTVQFFDNGVAIGSPIPVPASGVVTLTTTALPCAADVITAVYTPPANSPYLPSAGGPVTINLQGPDFSIAATPANQTINPGDATTYAVSLSGVSSPFTSPVSLTATCNCQGVTITLANSTITPGAGPTTTTMTVTTAPNFASVKKPSSGANGIFYGLLLLPLLGVGRIRRKLRTVPKGISSCLAALLLLGGLGAMTGCGGGYYGPTPKTCTITVTGTSGSLNHSTTVTLTVR